MVLRIAKNYIKHEDGFQVEAFCKRRGLPANALLLLDNEPYHFELRTENGNIQVTFVLKRVSIGPTYGPPCYPRMTKLQYRNDLLSTIVALENIGIREALKKLTIKDATLN